jgi:hypothetical protein
MEPDQGIPQDLPASCLVLFPISDILRWPFYRGEITGSRGLSKILRLPSWR